MVKGVWEEGGDGTECILDTVKRKNSVAGCWRTFKIADVRHYYIRRASGDEVILTPFFTGLSRVS